MTIAYKFSPFNRFGASYISFYTRNGEESYSFYDLDLEKGKEITKEEFYKFLQENLGNVIYIHIADYDTQESIGFRRSDL